MLVPLQEFDGYVGQPPVDDYDEDEEGKQTLTSSASIDERSEPQERVDKVALFPVWIADMSYCSKVSRV